MRNKEKLEPRTQIITDIDEMTFNRNHDLWWTFDDNENCIDFFAYNDFYSYVRNMINDALGKGYIAVSVETKHRIDLTFAKGKSKIHHVFQMSTTINHNNTEEK